MEKVSVLASGGLDSSVLIAKLADGAEVYPIYVRCGFKWEDAELAVLRLFVHALGNPNVRRATILSVPTAALYGDHWSVTGASVPAADEPDENTYLPGRNILLISLAAIWCSTHGVSRIAIGSLGGNPFPDATPDFFDNFGRILSMGLGHNILVEAPLRGLHKEDLIRQFKDLPLQLTLTCMAPLGSIHCGQCNKCFERQQAFHKAGILDRTTYLG
ncbi:MAG: 7-cyano-7-deazaguanine synthase [Candidatus Binatus sp.]|uniref:7-cyano-7-deazaguanine synthase n=1 Tax=Candidatus Binatus sp. TaxID=2811406 RepID=UPI003BAEB6C1